MAVGRRAGRCAGRHAAAALRQTRGQSGHGGAGACASLYIFDLTPAECWQWLCNVSAGCTQRAWPSTSRMPPAVPSAGRTRRRGGRAEEYEDETTTCGRRSGRSEDKLERRRACAPPSIGLPAGCLACFHWGHKVTQERRTGRACPAPAPEVQTPPQPEPAPVQVRKSRPRAL